MSFQTLKMLSALSLPAVISDSRHGCALRTLDEAGLIKATFLPESTHDALGTPRITVVVASITALGWMMIHAFSNEEPPSDWLGPTEAAPLAGQFC